MNVCGNLCSVCAIFCMQEKHKVFVKHGNNPIMDTSTLFTTTFTWWCTQSLGKSEELQKTCDNTYIHVQWHNFMVVVI